MWLVIYVLWPISLQHSDIFSFFVYIPVIHPIKTVFSSNCPTIVIKEAGSSKTSNTPPATPCDLTDDEKAKLDERKLSKLFNSFCELFYAPNKM